MILYSSIILLFILQAKDFTFRGHSGSVDQLCWHATNPDLLATASGDKTARIWDARTQKCAATINTKGMLTVSHLLSSSLLVVPAVKIECRMNYSEIGCS